MSGASGPNATSLAPVAEKSVFCQSGLANKGTGHDVLSVGENCMPSVVAQCSLACRMQTVEGESMQPYLLLTDLHTTYLELVVKQSLEKLSVTSL